MQTFYRVKEVSRLLGVSNSTIWRWVKLGIFPKPKKIGLRVAVWGKDQIEAFIQS